MEPTRVSNLVPGGEAIATCSDGKKLFLWNALPGELVEYEITRKKTSFVHAIATNIIEPSPHRIEPRDTCHLSTSPWQIMNYDYERKQKSLLIQEIFRQQGIDITLPKVHDTDTDFQYRNKMEYSLYWSNATQKIYPAFRARGTHRKVPITQSSIERPELWAHAIEVIDNLNAHGEQARKYQSLLLRCNQSGHVEGGLLENYKPHPIFPLLTDTILSHEYSYSPNGFFQINLPVYELALNEIAKHISTDNVLDLYAGVGTIGLSVARNKNLTLVEVNGSAFKELENNCKDTGANPILAKSEEILDHIQPDQTIIVDPPRAGCDKRLIAKLAETKPEKVIYLSCNPITQARDITPLLEHYSIDHMSTYNFFPRTPHIENLVILTRK